MDTKRLALTALPAAALFAAMMPSSVLASYVCTGAAGPADPLTPYFNGDLTDARCDITEVEAALGITIDQSLIAGSKTNSNEDTNGDVISWTQDEFGLGTLDITSFTNNTGTWSLTGSTAPLFFVDKYNGAYDIYTYMGGSTSPFSDSWTGTAPPRGSVGAPCSEINCNANTSHLAVYGVVPIPAAVWLFGSGLLGLIGVARKRG